MNNEEPARLITEAVIAGMRQMALGMPKVGEAFTKMGDAIRDFGEYLAKMERGEYCGNRNIPAATLELFPEHECLDAMRANRREWRRCKRYWTQTKRRREPRGDR